MSTETDMRESNKKRIEGMKYIPKELALDRITDVDFAKLINTLIYT
jgi:hypothetical protein